MGWVTLTIMIMVGITAALRGVLEVFKFRERRKIKDNKLDIINILYKCHNEDCGREYIRAYEVMESRVYKDRDTRGAINLYKGYIETFFTDIKQGKKRWVSNKEGFVKCPGCESEVTPFGIPKWGWLDNVAEAPKITIEDWGTREKMHEENIESALKTVEGIKENYDKIEEIVGFQKYYKLSTEHAGDGEVEAERGILEQLELLKGETEYRLVEEEVEKLEEIINKGRRGEGK